VKVSFSGQAVIFPVPDREKKMQIINFAFQLMIARELTPPRPHPPTLRTAGYHNEPTFRPLFIHSQAPLAPAFLRIPRALLKIELFLAFAHHSGDEESFEVDFPER
jgi:hypothetical protein